MRFLKKKVQIHCKTEADQDLIQNIEFNLIEVGT